MADNDSQQPRREPYGGPPPSGQYGSQPSGPLPPYPGGSYPSGYPTPGYPATGYPSEFHGPAPGYPQPYYPYGQPPGYPPIYGPPQQPGPRRPALVITAAVLAYVNSGMIILAGLLLLFGASVVTGLQNATNSTTNYGLEIALLGVANLVAAGLLIGGAVAFAGGKSLGRTLLSVGNGIVVALTVYWLARLGSDQFRGAVNGLIVWGVIFAALAIVAAAFSFNGSVNQWLRERAR